LIGSSLIVSSLILFFSSFSISISICFIWTLTLYRFMELYDAKVQPGERGFRGIGYTSTIITAKSTTKTAIPFLYRVLVLALTTKWTDKWRRLRPRPPWRPSKAVSAICQSHKMSGLAQSHGHLCHVQRIECLVYQ
jgi:hypothetical protein